MNQRKPRTLNVVVSREKLKEAIDLINDATSSPGEEFDDKIRTIDGCVALTKCSADGELFWLTITRD